MMNKSGASDFRVGDRVVDRDGRQGEVIELRHMSAAPGRFPVVRWDSGLVSFSGEAWGLCRVAPDGQLALF